MFRSSRCLRTGFSSSFVCVCVLVGVCVLFCVCVGVCVGVCVLFVFVL